MTDQAPMEQAPTPSIEERVGKAFSNFMGYDKPKEPQQKAAPTPEPEPEPSEVEPEATTDAEEPAATAEDIFEFEFDGDKFALPKKLERAVQNMRDYTQKTQSVSEQRKTLEAVQQQQNIANMHRAFEQETANERQEMSALDTVITQSRDWNWQGMNTDELLRNKKLLDDWKDRRNQLKEELQGKVHQFNDKLNKSMDELRTKAVELAKQRIPGWSEEIHKAVREHAKSEGYTEAELSMADLDPRHRLTLWKAQQFDLLKSKAAKAVTDVKSVKTTSSNPMPQQVKDKLAFNKAYKAAANPIEQKHIVEKRIGAIFAKR